MKRRTFLGGLLSLPLLTTIKSECHEKTELKIDGFELIPISKIKYDPELLPLDRNLVRNIRWQLTYGGEYTCPHVGDCHDGTYTLIKGQNTVEALRGLKDVVRCKVRQPVRKIRQIPLYQLEPSPWSRQPAKETVDRMVASIWGRGILLPLEVVEILPYKYRIINGRTRYEAAKHFTPKIAPCIILPQLVSIEEQLHQQHLLNSSVPYGSSNIPDVVSRFG